MQNLSRTYKTCIFENGDRSPLSVEVFSSGDTATTGYLFRVLLMHVTVLELNLNGGRFIRYCEDSQPWACPIDIDQPFEERVNWIYRYVKGKWSFHIDMPNVHGGTVTFSFENASEAIHFRLAH